MKVAGEVALPPEDPLSSPPLVVVSSVEGIIEDVSVVFKLFELVGTSWAKVKLAAKKPKTKIKNNNILNLFIFIYSNFHSMMSPFWRV